MLEIFQSLLTIVKTNQQNDLQDMNQEPLGKTVPTDTTMLLIKNRIFKKNHNVALQFSKNIVKLTFFDPFIYRL